MSFSFTYEEILSELELKSIRNYIIRNTKYNLEESINESYIKKSSYLKTINSVQCHYDYITSNNYKNNRNLHSTHWFYYYKGKFHPQMIRAIYNIIGCWEGSKVLDPFCGSGTAAVEAQLLGINFTGIDISPVCKLISNVKSNSIYYVDTLLELNVKINNLISRSSGEEKTCFNDILNSEISDIKVKEFFILARLITLQSLKKSNYNFINLYQYYTNSMIRSLKNYKNVMSTLSIKPGMINIDEGDSRNIKYSDNSYDGIVTSPPYFNALNYIENESTSYSDLNIDSKNVKIDFIGLRTKGTDELKNFNIDIKAVFSEMYRVLKKDKYAVVIIGNNTYKNSKINNVKNTITIMSNIGFKLEKNIPKDINGKVNHLLKENILFFKK